MAVVLSGAARSLVRVAGRPLDGLLRARAADSVVVLIYHRVGGGTASPVDLPLEVFRHQLDVVREGARVLSLDEAVAALRSDRGLSGRSVVLTFDDGTQDWPDVVMNELADRRLPAVFYVATDFVERGRSFPDHGRPVSWAGLEAMVSTGLATIGSHTHTHRVLARASAREAVDEIDRSVGLLADRLGVAPRHFAYPKAVPPSPAAEVVVRRRFESAVLAGNRANRPGGDPHRIGRHALTRSDDDAALRHKVAGGMVLEGWLRERRDVLATSDY